MRPALKTAALLATLAAVSAHAGPKAVILSGWDVVARPGEAVTLSVKVEREGFGFSNQAQAWAAKADASTMAIWRRDIEGAEIAFGYQGASLGSDASDDDGTATVEWTPPGLGDHEVTLDFAGTDKFKPASTTLLVSVRDPDARDTLIFDIDHTLCETNNWNVIRGKTDDPSLPGSLEVFEKLAADHDVIYVTARPDKFLDVTRRWVKRWGFARNPIFLLPYKKYPTYNEAKYKTETITRLKSKFPRITMGFGDKESDAKAYTATGLRTFILGDAGGVDGAEEVADWAEIDSILFDTRAIRFGALFAPLHP